MIHLVIVNSMYDDALGSSRGNMLSSFGENVSAAYKLIGCIMSEISTSVVQQRYNFQ